MGGRSRRPASEGAADDDDQPREAPDVIVDPLPPMTPGEIEAAAQRLAALVLRRRRSPAA